MKLIPCPGCARHVRATEARCVFCSYLLAGGLSLAVALSPGCKGREVINAAPAVPSSSTGAEPGASSLQPGPAPSSASVSPSAAAPSSSPERSPSPPEGSLGLGNIGTVGVYGPPPTSDAVPNTRIQITGAEFTGPAVPGANDVISAASPGIRSCYLRALEKKRLQSGTISVTIELGKAGEVTSVSCQKSGSLTEPVRTCIAARMSSLKFQPPEGGAPSTLQFNVRCDEQPR